MRAGVDLDSEVADPIGAEVCGGITCDDSDIVIGAGAGNPCTAGAGDCECFDMIEADALVDADDEGAFITFGAGFEDDTATAGENCEAIAWSDTNGVGAVDVGGNDGIGGNEERVITCLSDSADGFGIGIEVQGFEAADGEEASGEVGGDDFGERGAVDFKNI